MALPNQTVGPRPNVGGQSQSVGGKVKLGSTFKTVFSGAPNAPIQRAVVGLPERGSFGSPIGAPTVASPDRKNYGTPSGRGIAEAAKAARDAKAGFDDPTSTMAFRNLMGLAQEQTGRQASERARGARDAAQRRGYAGGFEDEGREAEQDRMEALAASGFAGADAIRTQEGEQYGRAIGAFTSLQNSYNEAKSAGDIAFARDLTATHLANAENILKTAGLNMEQQLSYAGALNDAKMLQAKLDQDFNNSLIDNNRYIEAQQQIAAQLLAQQMALEQRNKEFEWESAFKEKSLADDREKFELGLKANPNTALRTFSDPRYGQGKPRKSSSFRPGASFAGLT